MDSRRGHRTRGAKRGPRDFGTSHADESQPIRGRMGPPQGRRGAILWRRAQVQEGNDVQLQLVETQPTTDKADLGESICISPCT